MNDLDLEEIESHLYSQIYHSNADNDVSPANLPSENFQEPDDMKKPNRYFRSNPRSGGTKFQNKHLLAGQHNLKSPLHSDYYQQQQGIYSKSYERPQKRDISINQLVVLSAPQQPPIVCVANNSRNRRAAKWRAKLKEKRRKQKLAEKLISPKSNVMENKAKRHQPHDVITLSDSEEESCVELSNNWPFISLTDSDDENKNALKREMDDEKVKDEEQTDSPTDDVIFVEPVNASIEVINLDEEAEKNSDISVETASVASTNSFIANSSPSKSQLTKRVHQERKELLSTPDSASNDFIATSGSVDLNRASFNFSLHGKDFDNDKFIKPPNPTEHCETESSSSTTDNNPVNMMKTAVFNEIEFPKEDMFSDANLESFSNMITPSRKNATKDSIRASTPVEESSRKQDQSLYSSDSSSETDFEELLDKQKELLKSSKNLPDLSPMTSDMRHSPQQVVMKKNKKSNLSSKYDLIEAISEQKTKQKKRKSTQSNDIASESSSKKKNKSKKRKTDISNIEVTNNEEENSATLVPAASENQTETNTFDQSTDSEVKRKSRKSSPFLDDSSENLEGNEGRKKAKTKKKKRVSSPDSEENAADVESQKTSVDPSTADLSSSKDQAKTGTKKKKSFSSADSEDHAADVESQKTSVESSTLELSSNKDHAKTGTKKKRSFSSADSEDNVADIELQKTSVDSSASELSLNKGITKTGDSLENLDQSQSKKKSRVKKKKSFSGAESEDNVTDIEPIIPSQEASVEVQGKETHFEELNKTTENTLPSDNVKIKDEKIDDQITDQKLEVPIKTEDSEIKLETVEAKVVVTTERDVEDRSGDSAHIEELPLEGFTVVDEVKEDHSLIVLSDSDSNLSELEGQQDIQLNLEEPTIQNRNASSALLHSPAINLVDNTLEEVQQTMSNDPKLWVILDSDRMPTRPSLSGRRCNKCRERGHTAIRCTNKVVPKCKLCGEVGHYEPRCPNRICTQCGERSNYSTTYCRFCFRFRTWKCPICYLIGHKADSCPDLWRRYHLTTTDGPLKNHTGPALKPRNQLWCSGCARSGHLEYSCRFYQSVYPPADPSIKRYDNVYENNTDPNEQMQPVSQPVIPFETNQFAGRNCLLPMPQFLPPIQPVVYNQSSSYQYSNSGPIPMYPENRQVWINQGNMLPPRENRPIHDINIYPPANRNNSRGYYEFNFEDNLPNFISFEPLPPSNHLPPTGRYFNNNPVIDEMRNNFVSDRPPRPIHQSDGVDNSAVVEMRNNFVSERPPRPIHQSDGVDYNPVVDEMRNNFVSERPPRPIHQSDGVDNNAVVEIRNEFVSERPPRPIHQDYNPVVDEMRNNFVSNRPPRPIKQNDGVDEVINPSSAPRSLTKYHMSVFFSSSFAAIQNFLSGELAKLKRMSLNLKSIVGSLRKQVFETRSASGTKKCNRKLNMVLFGIYQLNEGGRHLIRLKNCKLEPKNSKLSQQRRQDLFRSYSYIFGNQKQANYIKLLRKI